MRWAVPTLVQGDESQVCSIDVQIPSETWPATQGNSGEPRAIHQNVVDQMRSWDVAATITSEIKGGLKVGCSH